MKRLLLLLASMAPAAAAPERRPDIAGFVSIAGGSGGWAAWWARTYCREARLVEAAAGFGAAARGPSQLWIYAENDGLISPELAAAMATATREARAPVQLVVLPPFGNDGHALFFGPVGSANWGPLIAGMVP